MKKILITDDVHPVLVEKLQAQGFECETLLHINYAQVKAIIKNYVGIVIRSLKVDAQLIDAAPNLKFIARAGSGLEQVDVAYAQAKNIDVHSSPEGNRSAVAEHTIGMMLCLLHKFKHGNHQVGELIWNRNANSGFELSAQTVGIIGFGNVGQAVAQKLQGFGCRILAHDKYKVGFQDWAAVEEVDLDFLLQHATIITLHLPQTPETINYVNEAFLGKLTQKPILINTARGELINLNLIKKSLDKEIISGLGLDVFPREPLNLMVKSDISAIKLLSNMPNCIFTPHSAGLTRESYFKLADNLAKKIINFSLNYA